MRPRPAFLLAALVALPLALAACDSDGGGNGLAASYFVGSWTLVEVRDDTGDRTTEVRQALADLDVSFTSAGQFAMAVDYTDVVNDAGTADTTITGGYAISQGGALVLTPGEVSVAFGVVTEGSSRAALSTAAVLINPILSGSVLDLGLVGTVALVIEKV